MYRAFSLSKNETVSWRQIELHLPAYVEIVFTASHSLVHRLPNDMGVRTTPAITI